MNWYIGISFVRLEATISKLHDKFMAVKSQEPLIYRDLY